tara:strand:+ start:6596 stop:7396 length:801 start_codon:yes stop_codon:yes gene_type:complete
MTISDDIKKEITKKIKSCLKLESRIQEKKLDIQKGDKHPFLLSLCGSEFLLTTKVGQSLQTTFGQSLYETLCCDLAIAFGNSCEKQKKIYGYIDDEITLYLNKLENIEYKPNREREIQDIRDICKSKFFENKDKIYEYPDSTVDIFVENNAGTKILIDITTVKNNKKSFRALKRKTLEWAAIMFSQNPEIDLEPFFGIPYNPESPNLDSIEYTRWNQYYDRKDILVGDQLWRKVSNEKFSIIDLIKIFQSLEKTLKEEISSALEDI